MPFFNRGQNFLDFASTPAPHHPDKWEKILYLDFISVFVVNIKRI